ncbi:MAG: hypothetical protein AAAB35_23000 [Phyllobacterium sp.]
MAPEPHKDWAALHLGFPRIPGQWGRVLHSMSGPGAARATKPEQQDH